MSATEHFNPIGRIRHLDERRLVFLGRCRGVDSWFIGFRNEAGKATKLRLSEEALAALVDMYRNPIDMAEEHWPQPAVESKWRLIASHGGIDA